MNSNILSSFIFNACVLLVGACIVAPGRVDAATVSPSASVTVTKSYAYTSFGGGDFVFTTSAAAPGCGTGWYIKSTDPGFKSAVAAVLTAQAGGNYVLVYGDNSDLWPGSPSGQYCRVSAVGVTS
jgi:hypothetical protein